MMMNNTMPLKKWKTPMIESNGDYRDEAYLEDYIGGPLYEYQHQIPHLPIPSIEQTIARFLPTALPLVKSSQEKHALIEACRDFPQKAQILQQRLQSRRDNEFSNSSWLQKWWNQVRKELTHVFSMGCITYPLCPFVPRLCFFYFL